MSWVPHIGADFAGYKLESLLGHGGMSIVYRAEHLALGRTVALKLLSPELSEEGDFRERFIEESRVAASLDHPNIIPIHEAGEENGIFFIAMRFVDGPDLRTMIKQDGHLSLEKTTSIISQVAAALDAAHAKGLVHRDVKPANILVASGYGPEQSDHAYLSDFGVAKHTSSRVLTKTGLFVGTVDYAAPEQIEGKPLDGRADIYALGCVLYECLTGARAYDRDSEVALMYAHLLEQPPAVTERRPDLPHEIDEVVAKAMAKSRDDRYASGAELIAGLRGVAAADAPTDLGSETVLGAGPAPAGAALTGAALTTAGSTPGPPDAGSGSPPPPPPPPVASGSGDSGKRRNRLIAIIAGVAVIALASVLGVVLATRGDGDSKAAVTLPASSDSTDTSTESSTGTSTDTAADTTSSTSTTSGELSLEGTVVPEIFQDCNLDSPAKEGTLESATCIPGSATRIHPDEIELFSYPSTNALNKQYDTLFADAQKKVPTLAENQGRCNGTFWTGELTWYHAPDNPGGRGFCYSDGDHLVVVWTHVKTKADGTLQDNHIDLLGIAYAGSSSLDTLSTWWKFWRTRLGKLPGT